MIFQLTITVLLLLLLLLLLLFLFYYIKVKPMVLKDREQRNIRNPVASRSSSAHNDDQMIIVDHPMNDDHHS